MAALAAFLKIVCDNKDIFIPSFKKLHFENQIFSDFGNFISRNNACIGCFSKIVDLTFNGPK